MYLSTIAFQQTPYVNCDLMDVGRSVKIYQKPLGLRFKAVVYIFKKYAKSLFLDGALPHKLGDVDIANVAAGEKYPAASIHSFGRTLKNKYMACYFYRAYQLFMYYIQLLLNPIALFFLESIYTDKRASSLGYACSPSLLEW